MVNKIKYFPFLAGQPEVQRGKVRCSAISVAKARIGGLVPTWSPTLFSEAHHLGNSSEYEATQLGFQAYRSLLFSTLLLPSLHSQVKMQTIYTLSYTSLGKFSTGPTEDSCSGDDNSGLQVGFSFKLFIEMYHIY